MKRFLILFAVITILFASCSPNPSDIGSSVSLVRTIDVNGEGSVVISDLKSGELYTIYSKEAVASQSADLSGSLTPIGGTYVFMVPEGVTEIELDPSKIGLENGGELNLYEVSAPDFDYQDAAEGMRLGQGLTKPLFVKDDGTEVFESIFRLDTSTIPGKDEIAFLFALESNSSATVNHYFGFLDKNGNKISDSSVEAVMDLSGHEYVYVYMYLTVNDEESPVSATLYTKVPEVIDGPTKLSAPSIYMIKPSSSAYLVVKKPSGITFKDTAFTRESGARYASSGERFANFTPIAETDDEIILNVDSHSEAIIFDYTLGPDMTAEVIPNDGSIEIAKMGRGTETFTMKEGQRLFPIIFTPSSGVTVSFESEGNGANSLYLRSGHTDGRGYSSRTIHSGKEVEIESHQVLESGFIVRSGDNLPEVSFTISVN